MLSLRPCPQVLTCESQSVWLYLTLVLSPRRDASYTWLSRWTSICAKCNLSCMTRPIGTCASWDSRSDFSLFEMGFELQLREILHRLPTTRHNLLFSATLPTSLAEFAKAGLNNPAFIRLDTEHRISPDLELAFLSVKPGEKEAALLVVLREAIGIRNAGAISDDSPRAIIFASTKHHVEYLSTLLRAANYRTSYIYGSLDQVARQQQLRHFREGETEVLVVTDVAARGLDIPTMGHVINFDFPSGVRVFVHRVGRTARAGQKGHAWTLVTRDDLPYLHDLETFLERSITSDASAFGTVPRDSLEATSEYIHHSLEISEPQLAALRTVMKRGQAMFERSRSKASREGYRALKADKNVLNRTTPHPSFQSGDTDSGVGEKRANLLAAIQEYNPHETIFEVGARGGQQTTAVVMKQRRVALARSQARKRQHETLVDDTVQDENADGVCQVMGGKLTRI